MDGKGKILAPGVLFFERFFDNPIEKVWLYLTDSEKRGKWLAKGEMELFQGGNVSLHFLHSELSPIPGSPPEMYKSMEKGHSFTGRILSITPPRLLSFTWQDDSEVTFELKEENNGVRLLLTHRKLTDDRGIRLSVATGWHTHLEILEANLKGETPQNFWQTFERFQNEYQLMP